MTWSFFEKNRVFFDPTLHHVAAYLETWTFYHRRGRSGATTTGNYNFLPIRQHFFSGLQKKWNLAPKNFSLKSILHHEDELQSDSMVTKAWVLSFPMTPVTTLYVAWIKSYRPKRDGSKKFWKFFDLKKRSHDQNTWRTRLKFYVGTLLSVPHLCVKEKKIRMFLKKKVIFSSGHYKSKPISTPLHS